METHALKEYVDLIREVFLYSRRFRNSNFVIKIDSPVIGDPCFPILVRDLALLSENGTRIIIIPGARERINEILQSFGLEWEIYRNTRIAPEEAVPYIKMAAFDVANKVMTSLSAGKVNAVIGNWVRARAKGVIDGKDHMSAGIIEKIDLQVIAKIMDQGLIPIFPCIGWNSMGKPYNISSDELAVFIASSLKAEKLFFIRKGGNFLSELAAAPKKGVVVNEGRVSRINAEAALPLLDDLEDNEEKRLLELAVEACKNGVDRVHIVDGTTDGVMLKEIFSNQGIGALIHNNPFECIRQMKSEDVAEVMGLMNPLIDKAVLLPRTMEDLKNQYKDYIVFEIDSTIRGCAAMHLFSGKCAEIAALAVDQSYKHLGIGAKIVSYLLEDAAKKKQKKVLALTTQSEDWFLQMGFKLGSAADLPPDRKPPGGRNSKILVYPLT